MWCKGGDISVSRTPVSVFESASNGWQDLTVDISGKEQTGGIALLKFKGKAIPPNRSYRPRKERRATARSSSPRILPS